jgi:glycine dehydrogenase subunit 2
MKYNPRVNERVVGLPGFRDLHPLQDEDGAQGALELMWRLQEILAEVTGLHAVSLQPAAGSQGELTGLLLMRAYFEDRGEGEQRRRVVTSDTAHGTNPASVTMAGYELVGVKTDARGNVDVEDLRAKVDETTAGLMLTNPSTLGLFDENIEEIRDIFHGAGALMYYDGANLNAVCGISRPGDMGFDIVHINLHKTFSQPHGGGGPGAARSPCETCSSRICRCRRSCATASASATTTTARSRSARCAASPVRSASSCAPTRSSARGARSCARCPRPPS